VYVSSDGWWTWTVKYGDAIYAARCPDCGRRVKTDKVAKRLVEFANLVEPNATCKKHGRVKTPFLDWDIY
jgi:hypothetical protein